MKNVKIPEKVKIEKLKGGLNIVELFHGATMAFKDLGLLIVGELLSFFLKKNHRNIVILVGKYFIYIQLFKNYN